METASTARHRLLAELPVSERTLYPAGIATTVLEGGEGPPIVLLHGPGEHALKWMLIIPDLARSHRIVAPDLPGHGASGGGEAALDAEQVLDWLDDLIGATCDSPPILLGQIVGGAIAARYAAGGPALAGLVLADSLGLGPFDPAPEFGAALSAFVRAPDGELHDRLWEQCAHDLDGLRARLGERWDWLRAYNLDRARATEQLPVRQGIMERFGFPAIEPAVLERIVVPTVLIWGRHDLATPLPVAAAASARYGWPLHVIEDAADDPALEQPGPFVAALEEATRSWRTTPVSESRSPSRPPR